MEKSSFAEGRATISFTLRSILFTKWEYAGWGRIILYFLLIQKFNVGLWAKPSDHMTAKILRDQEDTWALFSLFLGKKADLHVHNSVCSVVHQGNRQLSFHYPVLCTVLYISTQRRNNTYLGWYHILPPWCTAVNGSILSKTMAGWTVHVEWAGAEEMNLYSIRRC